MRFSLSGGPFPIRRWLVTAPGNSANLPLESAVGEIRTLHSVEVGLPERGIFSPRFASQEELAATAKSGTKFRLLDSPPQLNLNPDLTPR